MTDDALRRDVARYYTDRLLEHGTTARGVDWRDEVSQRLRFEQLLRVADCADRIEIIDYGCGYGALVEELERDGRPFRWIGFDISEAMLDEARGRYGNRLECDVVGDEAVLEPADFVVASGIFNVRLEAGADAWRDYVERSVERLNELSLRGFAFNMLTSYSDPDKLRGDLYYADPLEWFDRCKRRYSRHVALLHDYGLWEFTLLVRKDVN
jgi:SAM-dependent methyltransferase